MLVIVYVVMLDVMDVYVMFVMYDVMDVYAMSVECYARVMS